MAKVEVERNGRKYLAEAPAPKEDASSFDILHGDHGIPKHANLRDFIWTTTDEPHANRRKAMMKDLAPEINKLRGYEPSTKWIVLALVIAQLSLGIYLREEALWGGTLKFWATAYFLGATMTQTLFLAVHETSHNLAAKGIGSNKLIGLFANVPLVLPFAMAFRYYHNLHHKYQGTEGQDEDLPTPFEARLLSSVPGKMFFVFNQTWFYSLRPVLTHPLPVDRWVLLNAAVQIAFCAGVVEIFGIGVIFYFLASAHLAGGLNPLSAHFIAEHISLIEGQETGSYYGWMNLFTLNVGYHDQHHDFPNIPWTNLPKLRKVGAKFYDKIPYHESWVGVLWNYVFDPEIKIYNRMRRDPKDKTN